MKYWLVSVAIFIFGFLGFFDTFRDFTREIFFPVIVGLETAGKNVKGSFLIFSNVNSLREANLVLEKENALLRERIVDLNLFKKENQLLKDQLNIKYKEIQDYELVIASVMGNPNDFSKGTILIDGGEKDGITQGSVVVVGESLVGYVEKVYKSTSVVHLLFSPSFRATVVSEKGIEALSSGNLGSAVVVSRILSSDNVSSNDVFYTNGKDGKFLPGFVVGRLTDFNKSSYTVEKEFELIPNVDLLNLDKVFVIIK